MCISLGSDNEKHTRCMLVQNDFLVADLGERLWQLLSTGQSKGHTSELWSSSSSGTLCSFTVVCQTIAETTGIRYFSLSYSMRRLVSQCVLVSITVCSHPRRSGNSCIKKLCNKLFLQRNSGSTVPCLQNIIFCATVGFLLLT